MNNENNINKLFGRKLRLLRMSKGLSQEELGLQCGLHRTYIGQIERAEKNITIKNVGRIAETLECNVQELFDFRDVYKEKTKKKNK